MLLDVISSPSSHPWWIKKEATPSSCTCAHLGGTARCGAAQIGSRGVDIHQPRYKCFRLEIYEGAWISLSLSLLLLASCTLDLGSCRLDLVLFVLRWKFFVFYAMSHMKGSWSLTDGIKTSSQNIYTCLGLRWWSGNNPKSVSATLYGAFEVLKYYKGGISARNLGERYGER
jgi:hypothetical protein